MSSKARRLQTAFLALVLFIMLMTISPSKTGSPLDGSTWDWSGVIIGRLLGSLLIAWILGWVSSFVLLGWRALTFKSKNIGSDANKGPYEMAIDDDDEPPTGRDDKDKGPYELAIDAMWGAQPSAVVNDVGRTKVGLPASAEREKTEIAPVAIELDGVSNEGNESRPSKMFVYLTFITIIAILLILLRLNFLAPKRSDEFVPNEMPRTVDSYKSVPKRADFRPTLKLDLGRNMSMELVRIEPGEFMMGNELSPVEMAMKFNSNAELFKDEYPQHRVKIAKGFYMGKFEVTRGQFRQFVQDTSYKTDAEKNGKGAFGWTGSGFKQSTNYSWRDAGFKQDDEHPVVNVNWNDAVAFCDWLSKKNGTKVRLPTEVEWEYACRGGKQTVYPWGNDPNDGADSANTADRTLEAMLTKVNIASGRNYFSWHDGYEFTAPVGTFKANAFGLHDMIGNVVELCSSKHEPYPYKVDDGREEASGTASRVVRGGCWYIGPENCRSGSRYWGTPGGQNHYVGFRVAMTVPQSSVGNDSFADANVFAPAGSEFAVTFEAKPTVVEFDSSNYGEAVGKGVRAELKRVDIYQRAEMVTIPSGFSEAMTKESATLAVKEYAFHNGIAAVDITYEITNLGLMVSMRGTKVVEVADGKPEAFTIESKTYYGKRTLLIVTVVAPSKSYPTQSGLDIFRSVRLKPREY